MIELELTYLAKSLPEGLLNCPSKEIIDVYVEKPGPHLTLRIRKNGEKYEMTKKEPVEDGDASRQLEQTIPLTVHEFEALSQVTGRTVAKRRYYYDYNGLKAEFDVFLGPLAGLVVVEFEFDSVEAKDAFEMPSFCLAEVSQEDFIAGGVICGKSYSDVASNLAAYGYKKLILD